MKTHDFLNIAGDVSHLSIDVREKFQAFLLLNLFPVIYDQLKETLNYIKDVIKIEEDSSLARFKEKETKSHS